MSNFIFTSSLHPLSISPHYILNIVNWTAPLWHSLLHINSKLFLYLLSTPPFYIPSLHTQHCRILSWYSSIAAGLPTGQKTTHPVWLPPFDTSSLPPLYTPFLHPLSTYYPIWLNPLFTLPLPYISSSPNCHSLSTLPLYSSSLPSLHPLFLLTGHKTTPHVTTPLLHSFWASH